MLRLRSGLVVLALAALLLAPAAAQAATSWSVNSTADEHDAVIDGICASTSGACTLRAAFEEADAVKAPTIIYLDSWIVPLSLRLPLVAHADSHITVIGVGSHISGVNGFFTHPRLFVVELGALLELRYLAVKFGGTHVNEAGVGGCIANAGRLILNTVLVTGCTTSDYRAGEAHIPAHGGDLYIAPTGSATIINSTLQRGDAADDGGIIYNDGRLVMRGSTIAVGEAYGNDGGGLFNAGTATISSSTFSHNITPSGANAIHNRGSLRLESVTIADNPAGQPQSTQVILRNEPSGSLMLTNTLLGPHAPVALCDGTVQSLGYNLAADASCGLTATGDRQNVDALLGPLAANGGPTATHALLAGSPAIDAGRCTARNDQRCVRRPIDFPRIPNVLDGCDMGAYERQRGS